MKIYDAQPLDLMQFINTKYHEPFIHAKMELAGKPDTASLTESVDTLIDAFPIKSRRDHRGYGFGDMCFCGKAGVKVLTPARICLH